MTPTNLPKYMGKYYLKNKNKFNNPEEKRKRRIRNKARREMILKHGKAKLKGKDVHHVNPLKHGGSGKGRLKIMAKSRNRANFKK